MNYRPLRTVGALIAGLAFVAAPAFAQDSGGLTTQATNALEAWQTFFLALGALILILVVFFVGVAFAVRKGGMEGLWTVALGGFIMGNAVVIGTLLYGG